MQFYHIMKTCVFCDLENNLYSCPFSDLAFKRYLAAVLLYSVFYNRKHKTGAAGFFGMAFVYTVEALKDSIFFL